MSDLEKLGYWCRVKADDPDVPIDERHLWTQISDEIDAYLGIHDANEPGLFEATS